MDPEAHWETFIEQKLLKKLISKAFISNDGDMGGVRAPGIWKNQEIPHQWFPELKRYLLQKYEYCIEPELACFKSISEHWRAKKRLELHAGQSYRSHYLFIIFWNGHRKNNSFLFKKIMLFMWRVRW